MLFEYETFTTVRQILNNCNQNNIDKIIPS